MLLYVSFWWFKMTKQRGKDEKPLQLKSHKSYKQKHNILPDLACIVHYDHKKPHGEVRRLTKGRFEKINDCIKIRTSQTNENERLVYICSNVPSEYYPHLHGAHRWCYQNFTNISRLLKRKRSTEDDPVDHEVHCPKRCRNTIESSSTLLPADKCLFCEKKIE